VLDLYLIWSTIALQGTETLALPTNNIQPIVNNPVFNLIWVSLASGFLGFLVKAVFDLWRERSQRLKELSRHIMDIVEKTAPRYFLMSNYANHLSSKLHQYLETKQQLILEPKEWKSSISMYKFSGLCIFHDEKNLQATDSRWNRVSL
jgi:hypothetical protein